MLHYWLLLGLVVTADEREKPIDRAPLDAPIERPSLALLEFLGSFENADGEWVDPLSLPVELDSDQIERKGLDDKTTRDEPNQHDDASNDETDDNTTQTAAVR